MCIALPGKVLERQGDRAVVDLMGERREVDLGPLRPKVGSFVLVQGRVAVQRLSALEARKIVMAVGEVDGGLPA